ncbi:hypothetical protein Lser_V15G33727 [Lactuca serriola]
MVVTEPKRKEASGSGVQDKGKGIDDNGEENDLDDIEDAAPISSAHKAKPTVQQIKERVKEAINKENEERELKQRKLKFPPWSLERLRREVIEAPSLHWLEPVLSFEVENSKDSQFDMPITRKAFIFHCFESTVAIPSPDPIVDQDLLNYYHEFSQPQYLTWSSKKIITVKVLKPTPAGKFINIKIKVTRGSDGSVHTISLADLPNLNSHDWILRNNILLSNPKEYEPIIGHIKHMLVCYIHEVAKMDQEIATVIRKKPTVKPIEKNVNINSMVRGKIDPQSHTVMFQRREGQKCIFAHADKHLFSDSFLEHILEIIYGCDQNSEVDKKLFSDMLRWYMVFRKTLLSIIPRLFKVVKRTSQPPLK